MKTLLIDLETFSPVDITKSGVYKYVEHDDFEIVLFSYSRDGEPARLVDLANGEAIPEEVVSAIFDPSVEKVAHNMVFEITCLSKYFGKELDPWQWHDTMIMAAYLGLPLGLAAVGDVLKLEQQKLASGKRLISLFCCPDKNGNRVFPEDKPDKWEDFKAYCVRDVDTEVELYKKVCNRVLVPAWERELQILDYRINKRGVRIDTRLAANAVGFWDRRSAEMTERLRAITGLENPNSVAQLKDWIKKNTGKDVESLNKVALQDLLRLHQWDSVGEVLRLRQELGKTSVKKYEAMLNVACKDGRAHGITQYYGTLTGRFCLTGDHEVLTPNGWVRLDEWNGGRIMCWNKDSEILSFQRAKANVFDYEGEMIDISNSRCFQLCTPEHKMPVWNAKFGGWSSEEMKNLKKRFSIPFHGRMFRCTPNDNIDLRVLIMVQADGHYTEEDSLCLHFTKVRKIERCRMLLRRAQIVYREKKNCDNSTSFHVAYRNLPLYLREFHEKKFGWWMLNEDANVILDEIAKWDGSQCGPNSIQYTSTVRINAEIVQALAVTSGRSATLLWRYPPIVRTDNRQQASTAYVVNIWNTPGHYTTIRREHIREVEFSGKVYCPTTNTGFFMVRRNGRVWITGNSGRLVQTQNLPQNHIPDLEYARNLLYNNDYDGMEMSYESISDTLSQLIRTALIPSDGRIFHICDFSAIECRVLAWLAGENWVLDVFRNGGDIYCATASRMFGVPVEKHGQNAELRQKGKIATLALGYQGGVGALKAMGGDRMGLGEDEMKSIVRMWRASNKKIVEFWATLEKAVDRTLTTGQPTKINWGITFSMHFGFLHCTLPSGRSIVYPRAKMIPWEDGSMRISYERNNQETHKWERIETYGGKLVENCIAEGTIVLTDKGFKRIQHVLKDDLIYDGEEFVSHEGLIYKRFQDTISLNGIRMTPDHRVLTEQGWRKADESEGHYWHESESYRRIKEGGKYAARKSAMGMPLRLWQNLRHNACGLGSQRKRKTIVWVSEVFDNCRKVQDSRNVKPSSICSLALDEAEMRGSKSQSVSQLRRSRDKCVHRMAAFFRDLLERYGGLLSKWIGLRQNRQQQRLQQGELQMDYPKDQQSESQNKQICEQPYRTYDGSRIVGEERDRDIDAVVSSRPRLERRIVVDRTKCKKPVYDIRNCGPRNQFVVFDSELNPCIVHNCTQAIARDILAIVMLRCEKAGLPIVFHVHDEVIVDAPKDRTREEIEELFGQPISWAPGLPLKGAAYSGRYYFKD